MQNHDAQHEAGTQTRQQSCSFEVTWVYLTKQSANQHDVGHILHRKMLKITNKEVLVPLHWGRVLDKGCILHQTTSWISSCSEFPWLLPFFEPFWSLLLLIFPGSPLIRSEAYCTNCDVVKVDFSRGGCFPSGGSGNSWKEELSIQCCSVQHFI